MGLPMKASSALAAKPAVAPQRGNSMKKLFVSIGALLLVAGSGVHARADSAPGQHSRTLRVRVVNQPPIQTVDGQVAIAGLVQVPG